MASHFSLRSSALGNSTHVVGIFGKEGLSRPYEFDIYVVIPQSNDLELRDVVTSKVTLSWNELSLFGINVSPNPPFRFSGMVSSFKLLRGMGDTALYVLRMVPHLWQLSLTRHSRIWTKKSFVDVMKEVLEESGLESGDYEFRPGPSVEPEEHICQYRESNLDFFHRWLEREGYYYYFEQDDDKEKLIITNSKAAHAALSAEAVRYFPQTSSDASAPRNSFDNFAAHFAALPATVRLSDYDYAKPNLELVGLADVSKTGIGEIAQYGNRYFTQGEAKRLAKLRAEEFTAKEVTYFASGNATHVTAGFLFTLTGHPRTAFDIEYLATEVTHYGRAGTSAAAWGSLIPKSIDDGYRVEVHAIEAERQYRHGMHTPWPRIDGVENAVVDGAGTSPYAQIDSQGRYAVKFKFDEGTNAGGKASTYVRMMQPHGGSAEGHHFPLRKGTEVICTFMGGDPDRPVIAGVVHNAVTPSLVTSGNNTQNVIQTGGGNRVEMEDSGGGQYINMYSPVMATVVRMGAALDGYHYRVHTDGCGGINIIQNFDIDVVLDSSHHVSSGNYSITVDSGFMQTTISSGYYQLDVNGFNKQISKGLFHIESTASTGTLKSKGDMTFETQANLIEKITGNHVSTKEGFNVNNTTGFVQNNTTAFVQNNTTGFVQNNNRAFLQTNTMGFVNTNTLGLQLNNTLGLTMNNFLGAQITNTIAFSMDNFLGVKISNFIGLKMDNSLAGSMSNFLGFKIDTTIGAALSTFIGVKADITVAAKLSVEVAVKAQINAAIDYGTKPLHVEMGANKLTMWGIGVNIRSLNVNVAGLHLFV